MRNNVPLGIAIFLATAVVLAVKYFRAPRPGSFPRWGWAGLAIILAGEVSLFLNVGWVTMYFIPLMWTGYLLLSDAMIGSLMGQSWIGHAPRRFFSLALCSVPLWLIFEAYNLRLQNWVYVGLPEDRLLRNVGYVWSFATIWPAIFLTADLVQALGFVVAPAFRRPRYLETQNADPAGGVGAKADVSVRSQKHRPTLSKEFLLAMALVGLAFVSVPLLVPLRSGRYLFGAVWLGFALLLDPLNHRWKGCSLLRGWEEGENTAFWSFLASGMICGVFWEFWNYWAAAKWLYVFPIWQDWKIFEMPAPGYLGFPAFALECFVMYEFLRSASHRLLGIRGEKLSAVSDQRELRCRS